MIAFGAHPDVCEDKAGGLAAKYAASGHLVKFVAITNGDAGHHEIAGGMLAMQRRAEALEAARRVGIEAEVLDNHDAELLPTLEIRRQVIRQIREWQADIVLGSRSNDYHPDNRYSGVLVQDAAYMVTVPNVVTDTPALATNPVFLYFSDPFQRPVPFRADVVVSIDDVYEKKLDMIDAHAGETYDWIPWHDNYPEKVPTSPAERRAWLTKERPSLVEPSWRAALEKRYGSRAASIKRAEAFEIAEYGRQPEEAEIRKLFPFFS